MVSSFDRSILFIDSEMHKIHTDTSRRCSAINPHRTHCVYINTYLYIHIYLQQEYVFWVLHQIGWITIPWCWVRVNINPHQFHYFLTRSHRPRVHLTWPAQRCISHTIVRNQTTTRFNDMFMWIVFALTNHLYTLIRLNDVLLTPNTIDSAEYLCSISRIPLLWWWWTSAHHALLHHGIFWIKSWSTREKRRNYSLSSAGTSSFVSQHFAISSTMPLVEMANLLRCMLRNVCSRRSISQIRSHLYTFVLLSVNARWNRWNTLAAGHQTELHTIQV